MERKVDRPIIILIIGLFLLGYGIKTFFDISNYERAWNTFKPSAVSTTAVISDISEINARGGAYHNVFVHYNDESGTEHSAKLGYWNDGMDIGDKVSVYYDKTDPDNTMADPAILLVEEKTAAPLLTILGVIVSAASVIYIIKNR